MFQNCISIKYIRANEMKNIIAIAIFIRIGQIYRYDKDSLYRSISIGVYIM